jgi:hypothetical protein
MDARQTIVELQQLTLAYFEKHLMKKLGSSDSREPLVVEWQVRMTRMLSCHIVAEALENVGFKVELVDLFPTSSPGSYMYKIHCGIDLFYEREESKPLLPIAESCSNNEKDEKNETIPVQRCARVCSENENQAAPPKTGCCIIS